MSLSKEEDTDDILSLRETFLVRSSRDFLRAASFALFASISARRRSANEVADDIALDNRSEYHASLDYFPIFYSTRGGS